MYEIPFVLAWIKPLRMFSLVSGFLYNCVYVIALFEIINFTILKGTAQFYITVEKDEDIDKSLIEKKERENVDFGYEVLDEFGLSHEYKDDLKLFKDKVPEKVEEHKPKDIEAP